MKVYCGSEGITPCILDIGTRWKSVVSFSPLPLYPEGKSCRYPLDRRLGGPLSPSGYGGEEKNSQLLLGLKSSIIQPVAQRYNIELTRLSTRTVRLKQKKLHYSYKHFLHFLDFVPLSEPLK
jgi:hypothetical protein